MINVMGWGKPVGRSWGIFAVALTLLFVPTGQAASPQALLVEAGVLFQRAEAMEGAEQRALLSETFALLLRIVTEYPESAIAVQLSGAGVALMGGPPLSLNVLASRLEENCKKTPTFDCVIEIAFKLAFANPEGQNARLASVARALWQGGRIEDSFTVFGYMTEGKSQAMVELLYEEYNANQFAQARRLWEQIQSFHEQPRHLETRTMENLLFQIEIGRQIDEGDTDGALKAVLAMDSTSSRDQFLETLALLQAEAGAYQKARSITRSISNEMSLDNASRKLTESFSRQGNLEEAQATALTINEAFFFGQALLEIASAQAAAGYRYLAQATLSEANEVLEETSRNRDFLIGKYFVAHVQYDFWDDAQLWERVLSHSETLSDKSASTFLEGLGFQLAHVGKRTAAKKCYDAALERHQRVFEEDGEQWTYSESQLRIIMSQAEVGMIEEAWGTFQTVRGTIQVPDTMRWLVPRITESVGVKLQSAARSGFDEGVLQAERDFQAAQRILNEAEGLGTRLASTDIGSAVSLLSHVALASAKIGVANSRAFPEALEAARNERRPYFRALFLTEIAGAKLDVGLEEEGLETVKEVLAGIGGIQRLEERFGILMGVVNLSSKVSGLMDAES